MLISPADCNCPIEKSGHQTIAAKRQPARADFAWECLEEAPRGFEALAAGGTQPLKEPPVSAGRNARHANEEKPSSAEQRGEEANSQPTQTSSSRRHEARSATPFEAFDGQRQKLVAAFRGLIDLGVPTADLIEEADATGGALHQVLTLARESGVRAPHSAFGMHAAREVAVPAHPSASAEPFWADARRFLRAAASFIGDPARPVTPKREVIESVREGLRQLPAIHGVTDPEEVPHD